MATQQALPGRLAAPLHLADHHPERPASSLLPPGDWLRLEPVPAEVVRSRGRSRWSIRADGIPLWHGSTDGVLVSWRKASIQAAHQYARACRSCVRAPVYPHARHPDDGRGWLRLDQAYASAWISPHQYWRRQLPGDRPPRTPDRGRPCLWVPPYREDRPYLAVPLAWVPVEAWSLQRLCWWRRGRILAIPQDCPEAAGVVGRQARLALDYCWIGLTRLGYDRHGEPYHYSDLMEPA